MSDNNNDDFPDPRIPSVYADGIVNATTLGPVAKLIFARVDPSLSATKETNVVFNQQIIIPIGALIEGVAFLEEFIEKLENDGNADKGALNAAREKRAAGRAR
ncbi:hypothetical protein [Xanthobacter agilis]|uniref:Uncharacterized protein n=1 Tax=Xanthobacter agilis TaxID=47492 RepID=A0ABU0LFR9_XANAG|nr:hypothetical protein [Xanthobacter agilis]MDQ0505981.1 hypothetical protein [Xanthobacter agilis]